MISEAKIKAIFAAAEDVLFSVDKDRQDTDQELAERIIVQARFIATTDPPTIAPSIKDVARKVVAIADGPEPPSDVSSSAVDVDHLRKVFDEANRNLEALDSQRTAAGPIHELAVAEHRPQTPDDRSVVCVEDAYLLFQGAEHNCTVLSSSDAHLFREAGIQPRGRRLGDVVEDMITLTDDWFGRIHITIELRRTA